MILSEEDDKALLALRINVDKRVKAPKSQGYCSNNDFLNYANGVWFRRWFKTFRTYLLDHEIALMTKLLMELE